MQADTMSGAAAAFVRAARGEIAGTLAPVRTDAPYALVDYPNYANAGDAAIWLGTMQALAALNGQPPAYTATISGFSPRACRTAIDGGTVYFLGGGNFGDLYEKHHRARLKVIAAMTDNPVVLLPLSVAIGDEGAALNEETRTICAAHPALTAFAREKMSQELLAERFGVAAALCPDLSLALDLAPVRGEGGGIVAILRGDRERRGGTSISGADVSVLDWYTAPAMRRVNRRGKISLMLTPRARLMQTQNEVAQAKLDIALSLIAGADAVVTDRLHAHLLATMLGIPNAAIDNATGKIAAYVKSWTGGLPGVALAASPQEALDMARTMRERGGA